MSEAIRPAVGELLPVGIGLIIGGVPFTHAGYPAVGYAAAAVGIAFLAWAAWIAHHPESGRSQ